MYQSGANPHFQFQAKALAQWRRAPGIPGFVRTARLCTPCVHPRPSHFVYNSNRLIPGRQPLFV